VDERLEDVPAGERVGGDAVQLLGRSVGEHDPALVVGDDDRVGHAGGDGGEDLRAARVGELLGEVFVVDRERGGVLAVVGDRATARA
jgi:hypothetical protein